MLYSCLLSKPITVCIGYLVAHIAIFRGVSPPSSCSTAQSIPNVESLRALIGLSDAGSTTDSVVFRDAAAATPGSGTAFLLSSSLPPVPAKLVAKVQALQFVEMKEFLQDNVLLGKRLDALGITALLGPSWGSTAKPNMRDVPSLLSWISCFTTYVAILGESNPQLVRSRLSYLSLVIMEARRNGGEGWRSYDTVFRQNAANNPDADWSRLDASLHASTFLAHRSDTAGLFCPLCFGTDHSRRDCAMRSFSAPSSTGSGSGFQNRSPSFSRVPICKQWNWGNCTRLACHYRHSCLTCPGGFHRAIDCPATKPGSAFKRSRPAPPAPAAPLATPGGQS